MDILIILIILTILLLIYKGILRFIGNVWSTNQDLNSFNDFAHYPLYERNRIRHLKKLSAEHSEAASEARNKFIKIAKKERLEKNIRKNRDFSEEAKQQIENYFRDTFLSDAYLREANLMIEANFAIQRGQSMVEAEENMGKNMRGNYRIDGGEWEFTKWLGEDQSS